MAQKQTLIRWGSRLAHGVAGAALVVLVYALHLESPWLSYRNLPFPTDQAVYRAGQTAQLTVLRCNSSREERVYRTARNVVHLTTGERHVAEGTLVSLPPGCLAANSTINRLPADLLPGEYRIEGVAEVRGLLRTHYVPWYSVPFEVRP